MGDVGARELQDALSLKSMLERLLTYGALASNKCPLSPEATALRCAGHDVVIEGAYTTRDVAGLGTD